VTCQPRGRRAPRDGHEWRSCSATSATAFAAVQAMTGTLKLPPGKSLRFSATTFTYWTAHPHSTVTKTAWASRGASVTPAWAGTASGRAASR